ncbi:MAG TPA: alpha-L-arabinofuranosidase C-terminal domain-containing protein [Pirellulales bacterium]|jgi:alpha-N-arabinofuranosidase|nr:alpha-L-arabinofuranosidase C-terminal domain-containing protein [Pirellulales bacterium]
MKLMKRCTITASPFILAAAFLSASGATAHSADDALTIRISKRPLHDEGIQINPRLFGNFIELLDDLVPSMRAQMINDRGFEGIIPPANWVYFDGSPTWCDREWDESRDWSSEDDAPFTGRKCAKIVAAGERAARLSQAGVAVKEGLSYHASGWFRSEGAVRVQVVLETRAPDGSPVELAAGESWKPTAEYGRFNTRLEPTGSTDQAALVVRVTGKGTVWADQLSLVPDDNRQGWRADVVEAIKASRPGLIRWGGSVVDPGAYRWKNGIGEPDRRQPFVNVNWGRIDGNDVGIDEFCQFCALVEADPLVCVSFSDGAASAADLVQYCNGGPATEWGARRKVNGHAAPYGVKYWQLGNEISGDDDAYIAKCKDFIASMKQTDPSIVVLSSFPSQKVLNAIGKDLGYLAPHHYTPDLGYCEGDFQKLEAMIAKTPGCGHLRLAVTEWNITGGDWGLLRGRMLTLGGALHNARYLNLLCRYSHLVEIACRSNMSNSFCSGIIETRPGGLLKRPSYHVMKLYADHVLPRPLAVGKAPANLDVLACASDDRRRVCLFAVNTGRDPVTLSLDLAELGADFVPLAGQTVCDTHDRRQPDVMNHWEDSDRVSTVRLTVAGGKLTLPAFSASAIECGKR